MMDCADIDKYTLYVGNLNGKVREEILFELFLQAGPVKYVKIPVDHSSGFQQKYGFVVFKHQVSVDYAIKLMKEVKLYDQQLILNVKLRNTNPSTVKHDQPIPHSQIVQPMPLVIPQPPFIPVPVPNVSIPPPYPFLVHPGLRVPPPPLPFPPYAFSQMVNGFNDFNNSLRPVLKPSNCNGNQVKLSDGGKHPEEQTNLLNNHDGPNRSHNEHLNNYHDHAQQPRRSSRCDRDMIPSCSKRHESTKHQIEKRRQRNYKCFRRTDQSRVERRSYKNGQNNSEYRRQRMSPVSDYDRHLSSSHRKRSGRDMIPTSSKQQESVKHQTEKIQRKNHNRIRHTDQSRFERQSNEDGQNNSEYVRQRMSPVSDYNRHLSSSHCKRSDSTTQRKKHKVKSTDLRNVIIESNHHQKPYRRERPDRKN